MLRPAHPRTCISLDSLFGWLIPDLKSTPSSHNSVILIRALGTWVRWAPSDYCKGPLIVKHLLSLVDTHNYEICHVTHRRMVLEECIICLRLARPAEVEKGLRGRSAATENHVIQHMARRNQVRCIVSIRIRNHRHGY